MFKKVSIIALLCSFVSSLFAGNVVLAPGARANNYAGAFTAIADDGTAIFWNPAGLAKQEKSEYNFSSYYINQDANASKAPAGLFDTTATFKNKNFHTNAYLPFISYSSPINNAVIAFGAYALGGGGGKWEDTEGTNYQLVDGTLGLMVLNASYATNLSDQLSVGAGLDIVYMSDEATQQQTVYVGTPFETDMKIKQESTGYGLQANLGTTYALNDELNFGLTFKSGSKIKSDGDATYNTFKTTYNQEYQLPMSVSFGSAYKATEKLRTSAQVDFYDYSTMKKYKTYETELAGVFENGNSKYNYKWNDIFVFSIGCEYLATDKLSLFAGYKYEPSPYNKDMINIAETNQYTYDIYSIGTEYRYDSGLTLGLNVLIIESRDLTDNAGVKYDYDSLVYRTTVNYKF